LVSDGYRAALATHIKEKAELARNSGHTSARRSAAALEALAEHVQALDLHHHALGSTWVSNANRGGNALHYRPGEEQERFLARLGVDAPPPPTPEALAELAEAAVEDLVTADNARYHAAAEQGTRALREVARLSVFRKRTLRAESELDAAREHVQQLTDQLAAERKQHDFTRQLVTTPDKARAKPDKPTTKKAVRATNSTVTSADKEE